MKPTWWQQHGFSTIYRKSMKGVSRDPIFVKTLEDRVVWVDWAQVKNLHQGALRQIMRMEGWV